MRKLDARQVAREKSAFRYSSALERGDFATVEIILQEAERDTALAQMLADINMVYESELIRLSPPTTGLNHSTNHHRKDLLMTTITLSAPQRSAQRWLPFTLAAACLSVLFIAALLMRPNPEGGLLAGLQGRASETPTALPTLTATPFLSVSSVGTALPPTVVPPDMADGGQPVPMTEQGVCQIYNQTSDAISLYAAPLTQNSIAAMVGELVPNESAVILYQETDPASAPFAATWFLMMTNGEISNQVTGWASANSLEPLGMTCAPTPAQASADGMLATPTPFPMGSVITATPTPVLMVGAAQQAMEATATPMPIPSVPTAVPMANVEDMVGSSGIACDSKDAVILSPTRKAVVAGKFEVSGIATGDNFGSYRLELIGLATGGNYVELINSDQPVASEGTLGELDLGKFPPNNYGLRLVVFDAQNQVHGTCLINFTLTRTAEAQAAIELPSGTVSLMPSGYVNVEGAALRDEPSENGQVIATLTQNTAVGVYQSSPDGLWLLVVLGDKTQGWISSSEVLGIEPTNLKPEIMCSGVTGSQQAPLFSRPNLSGNAVAIGSVDPNSNVLVLDMENQSRNSAAWYYVQALNNPATVGWVDGSALDITSYCPQFVPQPAALPATSNVVPPTVVPPAVAVATTSCTVVNTSDNSVPVYSGPSSSESDSVLVNNLAPNTPAQLLFQQTTSDGSHWYLMLAILDGGKQVSGWVDADGVQLVGENCATYR